MVLPNEDLFKMTWQKKFNLSTTKSQVLLERVMIISSFLKKEKEISRKKN